MEIPENGKNRLFHLIEFFLKMGNGWDQNFPNGESLLQAIERYRKNDHRDSSSCRRRFTPVYGFPSVMHRENRKEMQPKCVAVVPMHRPLNQ